MGWDRQRRPPMARSQRPPRRGVRLAVAGCVIFGMGVVVGALLGPLARPKTPASPPPPERATASAPSSSKTAPTVRHPSEGGAGKAEPLTFFQALKEASPRAEKAFVPFNPTGEAPPSLEALVPKAAAKQEAPPPAPSPEARRPAAVERQARYYVQVAAFQFKENARRLTQELHRQGYHAAAVTASSGPQPHQVRVGPYPSRREAAEVARRLQKALLYPTSVVRQAAPPGGVSRKNMN